MAKKDTSASTALQPDADAVIPRTSNVEIGYVGIKEISGKIMEEANRKLRYPEFLKEIDTMLNDITIATGVNYNHNMLSRVKWKISDVIDADETQKARAEFIRQCMNDMTHSWFSFIDEVANYVHYGFSVQEIVPRRRLTRNGSRYNDGLIGWEKLPVRAQSTIEEWEFDDEGRELLGCWQSTSHLAASGGWGNRALKDGTTKRFIPKERMLLFSAGSHLNNPVGKSPLMSIWTVWKYRQELEKIQAIAASRDLEGIPVIGIPAQFMSPDATPDKRAVFDRFQDVASNFHKNAQAGLIIPSDHGPDGKPLFTIKLLSLEGSGKSSIEDTIKRLNSQILMALGADVLAMGTEKVGSYSLSSTKTSLAALMLDYRLREIRDVLNTQLIPWTFKKNGWTDTTFPTFEFEEFDEPDMDEKSKYLQRVASQDLVVKDIHQINAVRKAQGLPLFPEDTDVSGLEFTSGKSRAGDGMSAGGMNGTSSDSAEQDTSIANAENT